ncbi:UDP-N-acetylglucosamine pyrophosphorylase [bacterium]|nr:UDP-N-acetylglucosamine pyrophosphorylase [bacterium]
MDFNDTKKKVLLLMEKGVKVTNPSSIDIGDEVDISRISGEGVVLYSGCKIYGKKTLVMSGTKLGYEAPVTIKDCQIGPNVELKGGFFTNSVFLEKANMGSCAQVRDACILEEEANGAHCVGLKHTILFPFVTLGSLINFCDCLMSGGTSRKNHSEVGSSYIHFNYTPNQDKATASLIGDVPRGIMLDQNPVFLGGQGGLVGPAVLGFGTVLAAGVVFRGDSTEDNALIVAQSLDDKKAVFYPGLYWNISRRVLNNITYCANLIALRHWYLDIRSQFLQKDSMGRELFTGALEKIDIAIEERISRFEALVKKLPESARIYKSVMREKASKKLMDQKAEIFDKWGEIEDIFYRFRDKGIDVPSRTSFMEMIVSEIEKGGHGDYISVIQGLDKKWRETGTSWLDGVVNDIRKGILEKIPSFG